MKDDCIFDETKKCKAGRHTMCNECIYGPNGTEFRVSAKQRNGGE